MTAIVAVVSRILLWACIIRSLSRAPDEGELWETGTQAEEPDNCPQK